MVSTGTGGGVVVNVSIVVGVGVVVGVVVGIVAGVGVLAVSGGHSRP